MRYIADHFAIHREQFKQILCLKFKESGLACF